MGGPPAHEDCNGLNHEGHEEHEETINYQSSTVNDVARGFDFVIAAGTKYPLAKSAKSAKKHVGWALAHADSYCWNHEGHEGHEVLYGTTDERR